MLYLIAGAVAAYAVYQLLFADDQNDSPPTSRSQSYEPLHLPVRRRDERQNRENIEASHGDHRVPAEASDSASLRARAQREGDLMAQCFQQSKEAYGRRDRARAKSLSEEGKRHAAKMDKLNDQASAAIFEENNQDKVTGEVDLHGLFVKEALAYSGKAVTAASRRGESEIRLIVGQGNHSEGGVSRLKPAIQEDMQLRGHRVDVDSRNPGVIVVRLNGRG